MLRLWILLQKVHETRQHFCPLQLERIRKYIWRRKILESLLFLDDERLRHR